MKFYCIDANTTRAGQDALYTLLQKNKETGRHIFIVPDRFTLSVEREICEKCFENGSFSVDTYSFTRMANKFLGNKVSSCLSKEGTVLLLHRIIKKNAGSLKYYKNISGVGFSRELFAAIASLRSGGITPDAIEESLGRIEGVTKEKLSDVALLYRAYQKEIEGKYYDTVSRLEMFRDAVPSIDKLKSCHIYVLGFNVFSSLQVQVLQALAKNCLSLSMSFCKGNTLNGFCYPRAQRESLLLWCAQENVPMEQIDYNEKLLEPYATLWREMYGLKKTEGHLTEEEKDRLRVFSALNPYDEIKDVCREIRHLVFKKGYRFKDIAVVCNQENYLPILSKMFERFEIPGFIDQKYMVGRGFVARYLRALFAVIESDYHLFEVMELVRQPLFEGDKQEKQEFERYCLKYNISYSKMKSPFAFGEKDIPEKIRKQVVELTNKITENCQTVSQYCDFVLEVLSSEGMKTLQERCNAEKKDVLTAYSDTEKIESVVEEIKKLSGEEEVSVGEFREMFFSSIEGMGMGLLPQYTDTVFVGSTQNSRFTGVKVMFIVGADDGKFPLQKDEGVILGCYDNENMKRNGLTVYPSPLEANLFEKFVTIDVCTKAEYLYLSYSENSLAGESLTMGEGVKEILSRTGIEKKDLALYYRFSEEEELEYRVSCAENCYYEYVSGSIPEKYRESAKKYLLACGKNVGVEQNETLCSPIEGYRRTKEGNYFVSVSMLENYFHCPFRHFLRDVLKLKEAEDGTLQVNQKGSLIHAVLEDFFRKNKEVLKVASDIDTRIMRSIEKVFSDQEYEQYYADEVSRYEMETLKKECRDILCNLVENIRHSDFVPTLFEKRFSEKEDISLKVGEKKFVFEGVIDRADFFNNKVAVIDYKTGQAKEDLTNVYTGEKIQLYVYLKYFMDKGYRPAGVFYLPLRSGYYAGGQSYAMKGQVVNDFGVLHAFENRLDEATGKYDGKNIGFGFNEDDASGWHVARNVKNAINEEDFEDIVEYVFDLAKQALEDIENGDIAKNPFDGGCEYCPYQNMCGEVDGREQPKVSADSFVKGEQNGGI